MNTPTTEKTFSAPSDDLLLSAQARSDLEVVHLIQRQIVKALQPLTVEQKKTYVQYARAEPIARAALGGALQAFKNDLEAEARRNLRQALGKKFGRPVDIDRAILKTRMVEGAPARVRRAAEEGSRVHIQSQSLWEAARVNFGFNVGSRWTSSVGQDFLDASTIEEPGQAPIKVADFVDLVRTLDLGAHFLAFVDAHYQSRLNGKFRDHTQAQLQLALLEAHRTGEVDAAQLATLRREISNPDVNWDVYCMTFEEHQLVLPLFIRRFEGEDGLPVFCYFPGNPDGEFKCSFSVEGALDAFREQLRAQLNAGVPGWLLGSLSINDQLKLRGFLKTPGVDESQLNWLARQLYRAFGNSTPAHQRINIQHHYTGPGDSLLDSARKHHSATYYADISGFANPTDDIDQQTALRAAQDLAAEVLELLLIPAPGGVTGLSRVMLAASLGTLAFQSLNALQHSQREGLSVAFLQAMNDILDMVVGVGLQGVATHLSSRRTRQLVHALQNPRTLKNPQGLSQLYWAPPATEQARRPALDTLKDAEVLEKLLHPDLPTMSQERLADILRLSGVTRSTLEAIWAGHASAPWPLRRTLEGELLRNDLDRLAQALGRNERTLPSIAERALVPLVAMQTRARVNIYAEADSTLLYTFSPSSLDAPDVNLRRTATGRYQARSLPATGPGEPLLASVLREHERQVPQSRLGRVGDHMLDQQFENRLGELQKQTLSQLRQHQQALYDALIDGRPGTQLDSSHAGKRFAPGQSTEHPAIDSSVQQLLEHYPGLSQTSAVQLLRDHPQLAAADNIQALPEALSASIQRMQRQNRVLDALTALQDKQDRGLNSNAEFIFCNLLTLLPGWPQALGIEVYKGEIEPGNTLSKSAERLRRYGEDTLTSVLTLVEHQARYTGVDSKDDLISRAPGENSLISAALHTLTDTQRNAIGYRLNDSARLAALAVQIQGRGALLSELLPADNSYPLSDKRLAHFRQALDLSTSTADSDGIHHIAGKRYLNHDGSAFQVIHDLEASTPQHKVWRIVHPDDAVADAPDNRYVATRPGRSEPVLRSVDGQWRGVLVGGLGGMRKSRKELEAQLRRQEEREAALRELIKYEIKIDQLVKLSDPLADAISGRPENVIATDKDKKDWAAYQLYAERLNTYFGDKLALLEKHRRILNDDPEIAQKNAELEEHAYRQLLVNCTLIMISRQYQHQDRVRQAGPFNLRDITAFRQRCGVELETFTFNLPYAQKAQAMLEKLHSTQHAETLAVVNSIRAQPHAKPYFIRVAMIHIRLWLLSIGDPLDPAAPPKPKPQVSDLATSVRAATVSLSEAATLPEDKQLSVLDTLQRQFEVLASQIKELNDEFTDPRDIAHILACQELITYFEQEASQRLQQRFDAAIRPEELARSDQDIDYDFIPVHAGPSHTPAPARKKLVSYKRRGQNVVLIGTPREEGGETFLDVNTPEAPATEGLPNPTYQKTAGTWATKGAPQADAAASLNKLIRNAELALDKVDAQKTEADNKVKRYDPTSIVERLEDHAAALDRIREQLRSSNDPQQSADNTQALIERLRLASQSLLDHGQRIMLKMYKALDNLDVQRLLFLIAHDEVQVRQTETRKTLGKGAKKRYLDAYRISDKATGKALWAAHFHYAKTDTPRLAFEVAGGHLKTLEQERLGAEYQASQEQHGQNVTPIWRRTFDGASAQKLFDKAQAS